MTKTPLSSSTNVAAAHPPMSGFSGFPADFFGFFEELQRNNNRDWFNANKTRFREQVQLPMVAFIEAMEPELMLVSPHFLADPRLNGGSMFRIYRDTRFSGDKTPYKTHAAAQFRHQYYRNVHTPGFYLHLAPDEIFCGGGIWLPEPPALLKIRERIRDKPALWQQVLDDPGMQKVHGGVSGEGLSRPPKGFTAEDPHLQDLKRKSFFAMASFEREAALRADFVSQVAAAFAAASPLVEFLCGALDVPF